MSAAIIRLAVAIPLMTAWALLRPWPMNMGEFTPKRVAAPYVA
jgi:hypothetical protein